jgi:hypothetical protein
MENDRLGDRIRSAAVIGTVISSVGLVFDIVGALLLWKYGLPAPINRGGVQHLILEQIDEVEAETTRKFDRNSRWGLGLLILGFALQFAGNIIPT